MYSGGGYNLSFDVSAIFLNLFILLIFFKLKDRKKHRSIIFISMIINLLIVSVFDIVLLSMRNDPTCFNYVPAEVSALVSHLLHNTLAFIYTLYIIYLTRTNYIMTKTQKLLFCLPESVLVIFSIVPPLKQMLYTIDENVIYQHGPLFNLYYVIIGIYMLITLFVLIRYRKCLGRNSIYSWIFFVGNIVSILISAYFPYLRATIFIQSLCAMGIFWAVENSSAIYDRESEAMTGYALSDEADILYNVPFQSAVISIKLQHFNYYISVFGRKNVYQLMRGISSWLSVIGGMNSGVYYPSPGSFTVIIYNMSRIEGLKKAEEIKQRFLRKWDVPGMNILVPVQIWLSSIPDKISNPTELISFAGSDYDESIKEIIIPLDSKKKETRKAAVEEAIRRGIRNRSINVYYQPITSTKTGSFRSAEALVRYTDEVLGAIQPEEFISVAEQVGLIGRICDLVFEKVCKFIAEEHPEQHGIDFISVNISAMQCMDENLARRLNEIAKKHGVNTRRINLEVKHEIFSYNENMLDRIVHDLRQNGFLISLDDFGKGYTEYGDLIKYPFTFVKIDRRMFWQAAKEEKKDIILQHMIKMLKDLNFLVVVEGVETEEGRDKLVKLGVEFLQGFLYSLPLDEKGFSELIKKS